MTVDASKPKKVTIDGQTVEQFGVEEKIKAEQFEAQKAAKWGFKLTKIQPPSGTGD